MGNFSDFRAVTQELIRLYNDQKYAEALEMVEREAGAYPDQLARTTFWRACLHSLSNRPQEALSTLEKGLADGLWWHQSQFLDSDFDSIREMPEFKALVAKSQEQWEQSRGQTKPERVVLVPAGEGPYPLLIVIHGRSGDKNSNLEHWEVARQRGWLVFSPQSTQALFPGAYCWDEASVGIQEIRLHFDEVMGQYPIDRQRIAAGGFSQGSGMAILTALQPQIQARGFIGVGTWWGDLESLTSAAKVHSTCGYFITGLKDYTLERAREIQAVLKETGSVFAEEVYPDLGHEFPPDFGQLFEKAIKFIWSEK